MLGSMWATHPTHGPAHSCKMQPLELSTFYSAQTHPSLSPLHQSWKLFSELHIYSVSENRWELVEGGDRPPAMAGHSATVHRGLMVVFGGLHKQRSIGHYTSSNDVWSFDLTSKVWQLETTVGESPLPRLPTKIFCIQGCFCMFLQVWPESDCLVP